MKKSNNREGWTPSAASPRRTSVAVGPRASVEEKPSRPCRGSGREPARRGSLEVVEQGSRREGSRDRGKSEQTSAVVGIHAIRCLSDGAGVLPGRSTGLRMSPASSPVLVLPLLGGVVQWFGILLMRVWRRRTAKEAPINIRAQLFAGHCAVRCFFDLRTPLGRHGSCARTPLADQRRRYANIVGQLLRRASRSGQILFKIHALYINESLMRCQ